MKKMIITNTAEVRESLISILRENEIARPGYPIDIYMYIDEQTGTASLSEYINVGGNSWINDDHVNLYRMPERHDTVWDEIDDISTLCDAAQLSEDELWRIVYEYYDDEDGDEYYDLRDAITAVSAVSELSDRVHEWYEGVVDDCMEYIRDQADHIIDQYNCELDELIDEMTLYSASCRGKSADADEVYWYLKEVATDVSAVR